MRLCPNCGLQIEPRPIGLADAPIEAVVACDDAIRLKQLRDQTAPHSANLVSGAFKDARD